MTQCEHDWKDEADNIKSVSRYEGTETFGICRLCGLRLTTYIDSESRVVCLYTQNGQIIKRTVNGK
jgi:hypothetical protein